MFCEMKSLKNIIGNLVTLSIPKVVKNGQKVPILENFEIVSARLGVSISIAFE